MIAEDQTDVTAFMAEAATHGVSGPVEVIETHISRIFLAGDHAFKMKRAVRLPYADFSTPQLRLSACEKEVELNSRTAPGLYLGVRRITRGDDDRLSLDGAGELVDAAVAMRRFDQSALLDRMAMAGALTPALVSETARMIADFHRAAPIVHAGGGAANISAVLDINRSGFATSNVFGDDEVSSLDALSRSALDRHAPLLDRRERDGQVRRCHGDLHLRNICLLDGRPRLFDCIEFNDQISTVDVLYDLAFLLMDLWHRGLADLANLAMNRYLDAVGEEEGVLLLPFLMAVRATVRAHVTATQVEESGDPSGRLVAEARAYFDLALGLLQERPPRLIVIGGLSGSGKTTIAEALAAHVGAPPGARIVESDRVRKAMHGVAPETRLPPEGYRPEISEKVYAEMTRRTALVLAGGGSVVADAVFDRPADRERVAGEAARLGVPMLGIWLEADPRLLRRRVSQRRGGPSDATVDVLERQLQRQVDGLAWRRIDAARQPADVVADILTAPIG